MTREVLYFESEPRGNVYRSLIEWLVPRSEEFWLMQRDSPVPGSRVWDALERLRPWRLSRAEVSSWPGTKSLGSATRYVHRCAPSPVSILFELSNGLFDWVGPLLPEDLCFVAPSRRTLLVNIAHEREAYLDLTAAEEDELEAGSPNVYQLLARYALPEGW